jgi:hypothetical protein
MNGEFLPHTTPAGIAFLFCDALGIFTTAKVSLAVPTAREKRSLSVLKLFCYKLLRY